MWMLINRTPWSAERNWVRDRDGRHQWIVAVKASFAVSADGSLQPAEHQEAPCLAPVYWGADGVSSIRYDSDLGPLKPATDILVHGHAYAPGGPVPQLDVGLRVDRRQKVLRVRGDSVFRMGAWGLTQTRPQPFTKMPIVYERAFGGIDTTASDPSQHRLERRNPIGVGFAVKKEHLKDRPAPNILYPDQDPADAGPAGFGAIASFWAPRIDYAGTYDARWEQTRKPLLPLDYDERFALAAPPEQQWPGYLQGGEVVELTNMTPDGPLRFPVPAKQLKFTTCFGRKRQEHAGHLVTVIAEPDERRAMFIWQTSLLVRSSEIDYLDATIVEESRM